jgi:hypothetical protein
MLNISCTLSCDALPFRLDPTFINNGCLHLWIKRLGRFDFCFKEKMRILYFLNMTRSPVGPQGAVVYVDNTVDVHINNITSHVQWNNHLGC